MTPPTISAAEAANMLWFGDPTLDTADSPGGGQDSPPGSALAHAAYARLVGSQRERWRAEQVWLLKIVDDRREEILQDQSRRGREEKAVTFLDIAPELGTELSEIGQARASVCRLFANEYDAVLKAKLERNLAKKKVALAGPVTTHPWRELATAEDIEHLRGKVDIVLWHANAPAYVPTDEGHEAIARELRENLLRPDGVLVTDSRNFELMFEVARRVLSRKPRVTSRRFEHAFPGPHPSGWPMFMGSQCGYPDVTTEEVGDEKNPKWPPSITFRYGRKGKPEDQPGLSLRPIAHDGMLSILHRAGFNRVDTFYDFATALQATAMERAQASFFQYVARAA